MDANLNIPFKIHINHDHRTGGTGYVDHDRIMGIAYGTDGQIKDKLRKVIITAVAEGLRSREFVGHGRVIGCNDGTVLFVVYVHDQWGYYIAGAGRTGCSFNTGSKNSKLEDVHQDAVNHANQSYGGVAWENIL